MNRYPSKAQGPKGPNPFNTLFLVLALIIVGYVALYQTAQVFTSDRQHGANELQMIGTLKVLHTAQEEYRDRQGRYGSLRELREEGFIDRWLAYYSDPPRERHGYLLTAQVSADNWNAVAVPAKPGETGTRSFYADESGVIRVEESRSAQDDPASVESQSYNR